MSEQPTTTQPTDEAGRALATWQTRHPWLWAIALSIGGFFLTAVGVAARTAGQLSDVPGTYAQAAAIVVSALVGLLIMWRTRPTLAEYGFRAPVAWRTILWAVPLALVPVIVVVSSGFHARPALALAFAATTLAVGFNEEIWYRGLVQAALRRLGTRTAVVGGSVIFGLMHLPNALAGYSALYVTLQLIFAALVGFVLAEVVAITGSLWVGIGWHLVYDFLAYSSGDTLNTASLIGIAVMSALLAGYSVWLWRKLPQRHDLAR